MINILSGETSIDISEFITIPDGIQWLNLEVDGETVYGELYNILVAINALAESASGLDFNDIQNLFGHAIAQFKTLFSNHFWSLFPSRFEVILPQIDTAWEPYTQAIARATRYLFLLLE